MMFSPWGAFAALTGLAALAQAPSQPPASSDTGATRSVSTSENQRERMICKTRIKSGTRVATKLCMTQANWDLGEERAKAEARELIDGPRGAITPPG